MLGRRGLSLVLDPWFLSDDLGLTYLGVGGVYGCDLRFSVNGWVYSLLQLLIEHWHLFDLFYFFIVEVANSLVILEIFSGLLFCRQSLGPSSSSLTYGIFRIDKVPCPSDLSWRLEFKCIKSPELLPICCLLLFINLQIFHVLRGILTDEPCLVDSLDSLLSPESLRTVIKLRIRDILRGLIFAH